MHTHTKASKIFISVNASIPYYIHTYPSTYARLYTHARTRSHALVYIHTHTCTLACTHLRCIHASIDIVYIHMTHMYAHTVEVPDFKNRGGGGKYGANRNNVRTFFLLLTTVILYNIYKLHYCYYIFHESPLVPFIFQNLLFISLPPK